MRVLQLSRTCFFLASEDDEQRAVLSWAEVTTGGYERSTCAQERSVCVPGGMSFSLCTSEVCSLLEPLLKCCFQDLSLRDDSLQNILSNCFTGNHSCHNSAKASLPAKGTWHPVACRSFLVPRFFPQLAHLSPTIT